MSTALSGEEVDETTCAVCMGPYKHKTRVFYLNLDRGVPVCDHEFCQECLVEWVNTNISKSCPLCRRTLIYSSSEAARCRILRNNESSEDTDITDPDDIYLIE